MRRVVGIAEGQLRNRRRRRLWCLLVAVGLATTPAPTAAQGVPDDFVIKLERTECYGECPVYSVSIDARGNVTYEGTKFVWVLGRQTDRIQVSRVATLLATAERIGFFDLHDNYNTISNPDGTWTFLTDLPTAFVTVTRGGRSKRVRDYLGAPEALKELEHLIDDTAGTKRWIRLDAQTLQQLVRDGWLPSRRTRTELLRKALQGDEVDMVKALLEIGADPNAASSRGKTPLRTVRSAAAARALLEAGAIPFAKDANDGTPLGWAVYIGPDVVEVLLKAGVPADEPTDSDGRTALLHAACVGDVGIVKVLLEAGANPTLRPDGTSALDCAREAREDRLRRSSGLDSYEDFDGVIALLEQALAKRK